MYINLAGIRTPLKPLMLITSSTQTHSTWPEAAVCKADPQLSTRTTILQRADAKRLQHQLLKFASKHHVELSDQPTKKSHSRRASRKYPMQVATTAAATGIEQARRAGILPPAADTAFLHVITYRYYKKVDGSPPSSGQFTR